jgi:cystathionine beta-lyase family protein involved in aluminum resistance
VGISWVVYRYNQQQGFIMKVWMRLGIEFDATEEEMIAIQGNSDKMMELMKSKEITVTGDSYIPDTGGLYDDDGEDINEELYAKIHPDCDFSFSEETIEIKD